MARIPEDQIERIKREVSVRRVVARNHWGLSSSEKKTEKRKEPRVRISNLAGGRVVWDAERRV
jgi:hypothetical protein